MPLGRMRYMKIGKPQREIEVVPRTEPVPSREPIPMPERTPEREREREPVPA